MSNSKMFDITLRKYTQKYNKTRALLQITGGKDEPTIGFMRKSDRTSRHRAAKNVKTHNRQHKKKLKRCASRNPQKQWE